MSGPEEHNCDFLKERHPQDNANFDDSQMKTWETDSMLVSNQVVKTPNGLCLIHEPETPMFSKRSQSSCLGKRTRLKHAKFSQEKSTSLEERREDNSCDQKGIQEQKGTAPQTT